MTTVKRVTIEQTLIGWVDVEADEDETDEEVGARVAQSIRDGELSRLDEYEFADAEWTGVREADPA